MQKYSGCIIEESLKDKSILDAFHILETREDDGISYIVEIEDSKVQEILPKLEPRAKKIIKHIKTVRASAHTVPDCR